MARLKFTLLFLLALMAAGVARADADLLESNRIPVTALPSAVERLVSQSCLSDSGGDAAEHERWNAYRMPLRPGGAVFFVQCRFAASNDVFTVAVQRPDGRVRLGRFSGGGPDVFNVTWNARSQSITDISQSGAGCTHERLWKWTGQKFALIRSKIIGCAS